MDGTSEKLVIKGSPWSRKPSEAFSSISKSQIEKNKRKEKLKREEKEGNPFKALKLFSHLKCNNHTWR